MKNPSPVVQIPNSGISDEQLMEKWKTEMVEVKKMIAEQKSFEVKVVQPQTQPTSPTSATSQMTN